MLMSNPSVLLRTSHGANADELLHSFAVTKHVRFFFINSNIQRDTENVTYAYDLSI